MHLKMWSWWLTDDDDWLMISIMIHVMLWYNLFLGTKNNVISNVAKYIVYPHTIFHYTLCILATVYHDIWADLGSPSWIIIVFFYTDPGNQHLGPRFVRPAFWEKFLCKTLSLYGVHNVDEKTIFIKKTMVMYKCAYRHVHLTILTNNIYDFHDTCCGFRCIDMPYLYIGNPNSILGLIRSQSILTQVAICGCWSTNVKGW